MENDPNKSIFSRVKAKVSQIRPTKQIIFVVVVVLIVIGAIIVFLLIHKSPQQANTSSKTNIIETTTTITTNGKEKITVTKYSSGPSKIQSQPVNSAQQATPKLVRTTGQ